MQWYWVDLAIVGIILLSVLTGLIRGFVKELIALGIWILAIWAAYHYSYNLDPWLQKYIQEKTIRTIVAFVLILIAVVITGGLINALLSFILKRSGLSGTDRLLGMGFGLVRGIFMVSLIITVIKMTSIPHEQYSRDSQLYAKFDPVVNWLSSWVPQFISQAKAIDNKQSIIDIPGMKEV